MKIKRFVSVIVIAITILTCVHPIYSETVKSYSDVPETNWAYEAIMKMTELEILNGTSAPQKGVATFSPDHSMTRAQLIAVITRLLYGDEIVADTSKKWYSPNYDSAIKNHLISENEFTLDSLEEPCTRQEMAMMLVRATKLRNGEVADKLVPSSKIPDYNTIDSTYRPYVMEAFSLGLINGVDSKGTFKPNGILTRAQAATIVYRLIDKTTRPSVSFETDNNTQLTDYDVKFSLSSDETSVGREFAVELNVNSNSNANVDGLIVYNLKYDSSILEFTGFSSFGQLITDSVTGEDSVNESLKIINLGYSPAIVANGKICDLKFKIKEGIQTGTVFEISLNASASERRLPLKNIIEPSVILKFIQQ